MQLVVARERVLNEGTLKDISVKLHFNISLCKCTSLSVLLYQLAIKVCALYFSYVAKNYTICGYLSKTHMVRILHFIAPA